MITILKFIAKSIPVIVGILIVTEIIWSNTLVGTGREVSKADLRIAELRQENERLETQVASASSLLAVSVKAKEMGFQEPSASQFVMIASDLPVAFTRP